MKKENKFFAALFKNVRLELDQDQTSFAKSIGVTQGYISKVESGSITPNAIYFLRVVNRIPFGDRAWCLYRSTWR